jgi:hypothetical protein
MEPIPEPFAEGQGAIVGPLNAILRMALGNRVVPAPPLEAHPSPGGQALRDAGDRGFAARLSGAGTGGIYTFVRVYRRGGAWVPYAGDPGGTAVEVDRQAGLDSKVVWLEGRCGPKAWCFSYPRAPGGVTRKVRVYGCAIPLTLPGATVTATLAGQDDVAAVTDATGLATLELPTSGDWQFRVSYPPRYRTTDPGPWVLGDAASNEMRVTLAAAPGDPYTPCSGYLCTTCLVPLARKLYLNGPHGLATLCAINDRYSDNEGNSLGGWTGGLSGLTTSAGWLYNVGGSGGCSGSGTTVTYAIAFRFSWGVSNDPANLRAYWRSCSDVFDTRLVASTLDLAPGNVIPLSATGLPGVRKALVGSQDYCVHLDPDEPLALEYTFADGPAAGTWTLTETPPP